MEAVERDGGPVAGFTVVEVPVEELYAVRRAVLRDGTPSDNIEWPHDHDPGTYHLAVRDDTGTVIAVSTWTDRPSPDASGPAVQLRGMAVSDAYQGRGLGAALVGAGVERARQRGAEFVWANARDAALGFYRANGFEVVGEGFVTADTQLPHHRILCRL